MGVAMKSDGTMRSTKVNAAMTAIVLSALCQSGTGIGCQLAMRSRSSARSSMMRLRDGETIPRISLRACTVLPWLILERIWFLSFTSLMECLATTLLKSPPSMRWRISPRMRDLSLTEAVFASRVRRFSGDIVEGFLAVFKTAGRGGCYRESRVFEAFLCSGRGSEVWEFCGSEEELRSSRTSKPQNLWKFFSHRR